MATVTSAVQVAVAEYLSEGKTLDDEVTVTVNHKDTGNSPDIDSANNDLKVKVKEIITDNPKNDIKATVATSGAVTATSSAIK